jgi:hypothetical protein
MSFNFLTTKRVFRVAQYDGIDDFVAFDLSGKKRALVQFLVGEFHSPAVCKRFNPLVAHSAPQVAIQYEIIRALRLKVYKSSWHGPWHIVDGIRLCSLRIAAVRKTVHFGTDRAAHFGYEESASYALD